MAAHDHDKTLKGEHHDDSGRQVGPIAIQKALKGVDYPASKQTLLKHASERGASPDVVAMIEQMPDHNYHGPADVMKGYGEVKHGGTHGRAS